MGRSRQTQVISGYLEDVLSSRQGGEKVLKSQGIDPNAVQVTFPVDDGSTPGVPAGVTLTPHHKAIHIKWDEPPPRNFVETTIIEVTPSGEAAQVIETTNRLGYLYIPTSTDPYKNHTVRIKFRNKWGRESTFSTGVVAKPLETAEFKIDLTKADMLQTLQGLLPNTRLATIEDATKLGTGVVLAQAMATQDLAAMRLWVGNAAIESAMIKDLTADKIIAGTINTGQINVASVINIQSGGRLVAGGARIDDTGLSLLGLAGGSGQHPSQELSSWMSSRGGGVPTPFAGVGFFNSTVELTRGTIITASGVSGTSRSGQIVIRADEGDQNNNAASTGKIIITSTTGGVATIEFHGQVSLVRGSTAGNRYVAQLNFPSTLISSGGNAAVQHGWGVHARLVHAQGNVPGEDTWFTVAGNGNNWEVKSNPNEVRIFNSTSGNRNARAWIGQ